MEAPNQGLAEKRAPESLMGVPSRGECRSKESGPTRKSGGLELEGVSRDG